MNRVISTACAVALGAAVAGCIDARTTSRTDAGRHAGFPPTRPITCVLPAVAQPAAGELASMTVTSLRDGSTAHIAIRPEGDNIRIDDGQGCVATRPRDWFSPSEAYSGCGSSAAWRSATGEVRVLDRIYPLTVGSTGRYWRQVVSAAGDVSTRETECKVLDAVAVGLPNRPEAPAYVVHCDDGRVERTTWYAPGTGPVAYREKHASDGVREAWVRVN